MVTPERVQSIATTVRLDLLVAGKEAERTTEGLKEVSRDLEALRASILEAALAAEEASQLRLFA